VRHLITGLVILIASLAINVHAAIADPPEQVGTAATPVKEAEEAEYALGSGDKLRVTVFGESDLSGEFVVDDAGFVRLPLIGEIVAKGRTVHQLEDDIAAKLGAKYMKDPRVSIEVLTYRPFYIIGEVNKPGEYPFVVNMSVLNAVAMAGGYTYRANESSVYIRRKGDEDEKKYPADDTTKLAPGDIVHIVERWF